MTYLESCTREQAVGIFAEFDATEETIRKDVQLLKDWLKTQPHLPNVEDDKWLTNILIRCKNNTKKAKKHLDDYYTGRVEFASDLFAFRDPTCQEIRDCFKLMSSLPAPKMTPEGYRIVYFIIREHTKQDIPSSDVFLSYLTIAADVSMKDDLVKGFIIIVDMKNISMPLNALYVKNLRKMLTLTTQLNKARLHRVYFVNISALVEIFVALLKSVAKKELAERIHVWKKNANDLTEILPKNVLSSTYGGDGKPFEQLEEEYYEYLTTFRDWLKAEGNVKADLSKKPNKDRSFTSYFTRMIGGNQELIDY